MHDTYLICECEDCNFSSTLMHSMDKERFPIQYCPVCGSEDLHCEENNEDGE